jgi:hypothetical protein
VPFIFTDGIGNAMEQIAARLGEFDAFMGGFGEVAQTLGTLATGASMIRVTSRLALATIFAGLIALRSELV